MEFIIKNINKSINDLMRTIGYQPAYFKKDSSTITFVKDRPGHDRRYAIDASKIKKEFGWKPKHSFRTSFGPTIAWYVQNMGWVKRALAKAGAANTHI